MTQESKKKIPATLGDFNLQGSYDCAAISRILFIRLGRFKREVRKLTPIDIPDSIRKAAEAKGYKFIDSTR